MWKYNFFYVIFVCLTCVARAGTLDNFVQKIKDPDQQENIIKTLNEMLFGTGDEGQKSLVRFALGYAYFSLGQGEKAESYFLEYLKRGGPLQDYAHYHLGQIYKQNQEISLAKKEWQKIIESDSNYHLKSDSYFELAIIDMHEGSVPVARHRMVTLEKKLRGDPNYPQALYYLLKAETLLKGKKSCKYARKLYANYPSYYLTKDWDIELSRVKVGNKGLICSANYEDKKTRIKNLQWAGMSEKALIEIKDLKTRNEVEADKLLAAYYFNEGEIQKSKDLLLKNYNHQKRDAAFLNLFGYVLARSGEYESAVGVLYQAYKLTRNSKMARQALFQAAFLSYQFQDYDGATKKFEEFIKKYPHSGLSRDAEWNLAWLKYLKGDYEGAYKKFSFSKKVKKRRAIVDEKSKYWAAMSLFKMKRYSEAKVIFESLEKSKNLGFYNLASRYRLQKLIKISNKEQGPTPTPMDMKEQAEENGLADVDEESEETITTQPVEGDADVEPSGTDEGDEDAIDAEDEFVLKKAGFTRRIEKAKALTKLGFDDWAKWDFFEIEKRTRNKEHLKILMTEYQRVQSFNRSSYIAEVYFGNDVQNYYESIFPLAYETNVVEAATKFSIPKSLIWGIMRQESHFKKDAVSPVRALGLMQIMPMTGKKIAKLLNENEFLEMDLLKPQIGINYGAKYLQRLLKKFNNYVPLVAASYNAGPHRVNTWLHSFGHLEMDEFIEHIPFAETRNYVKKVITNMYQYEFYYKMKTSDFNYLVNEIEIKSLDPISTKENWDDL